MALSTSLFAGVSGLRDHQTMMDVIGDNISNINTIGFKGSRVTFADTFNEFIQAGTNPTSTTGGTNSSQIGLGSTVSSIDRDWNQGTFEQTGITTDLALQGQAMFVLKSNGVTEYSRAGNFSFDANGRLVSSQTGAIVQGKVANSSGVLPPGNNLADIQINTSMKLPATATTNISWGGNLESDSALTRSQAVTLNGNLNSASLNVGDSSPESSTTVYNDYGAAYTFNTYYTKTADNTYDLKYKCLDSSGNSVLTDSTGATVDSGSITGLTFVADSAGNYALDTASQAKFDGAANLINASNTIKSSSLNFTFDGTSVTQNASTSTLAISADDNRTPNVVNGTVTVYDSLGTSHQVGIKYTKIADNQWAWSASVAASDTNDSKAVSSSGTLLFNSDGTLDSANISPTNPTLVFNPSGGATQEQIALNFGSGFSGVTQTSSSSVMSALSQDGSASASMTNMSIDQYGNIVGVFSNGKSQNLAQILVTNFTNLNGLTSSGDNSYISYANSGDPIVGSLGQETNTTIQSGALEQSNVDLSTEFANMIVAERGFQANARVITTADTLLQEITNLIR
jgi:flagellar hook protein FlgE